MPTYEYVCEACKHAWELEQRMVDDPVKKCPKCKKQKAKRMISGGGNFILKGGGWYSDLYSSSSKSSVKSDAGSGSTATTTTTSSDTKAPSVSPPPAATPSTPAPSPAPSKKTKAAD